MHTNAPYNIRVVAHNASYICTYAIHTHLVAIKAIFTISAGPKEGFNTCTAGTPAKKEVIAIHYK